MSTHFSNFIIISNKIMYILALLPYFPFVLLFYYAYSVITFINIFRYKS